MVRRAPVLPEIVRQHAEMAAFLWTVYERALLYPVENPEMDEKRIARFVERLEAHLDGLRIAGNVGREVAQELYNEYGQAGELFVLRMLTSEVPIPIVELDLAKVRAFLAENVQG